MTFFCVVLQMAELNHMGRCRIVYRLLSKVGGGFGGQCVSGGRRIICPKVVELGD
jgi:hypothetical protein